jgi:hypothetical protein
MCRKQFKKYLDKTKLIFGMLRCGSISYFFSAGTQCRTLYSQLLGGSGWFKAADNGIIQKNNCGLRIFPYFFTRPPLHKYLFYSIKH